MVWLSLRASVGEKELANHGAHIEESFLLARASLLVVSETLQAVVGVGRLFSDCRALLAEGRLI